MLTTTPHELIICRSRLLKDRHLDLPVKTQETVVVAKNANLKTDCVSFWGYFSFPTILIVVKLKVVYTAAIYAAAMSNFTLWHNYFPRDLPTQNFRIVELPCKVLLSETLAHCAKKVIHDKQRSSQGCKTEHLSRQNKRNFIRARPVV